MLTTSTDYDAAILAPRRKIVGKVSVSYSDPFLDTSVTIAASEEGYISQTAQAADAFETPTKKWASLDGSWVLDGGYCLCPDTAKAARSNQMGWWGAMPSREDCTFAKPPTLTLTFSARVVRMIGVMGDKLRGEYPVDFTVEIYASDTLIDTLTVTGNILVNYSAKVGQKSLSNITKLVLTITKWSHVGRVAKILEFFATLEEAYSGDDIFSINLLEEREFSDGSLPVGNISSNELTVSINNVDRRFDAGNTGSDLYGLIKPNRKFKAWLGVTTDTTGTVEWIKLGTFWSGDWDVPEEEICAEVTAYDRLDLLTRTTFGSEVYTNITVYDLFKKILEDTGYDYWIDSGDALQSMVIPYAYFDDETHRECLRLLAEASLSQVYVSRDDVIRVEGPDYLPANKKTTAATLTTDNYFSKNNPASYTELANYIEVTAKPLAPVSASETVYESEESESIKASETKTVTITYTNKPVINVSISISGGPSGLVVTKINYYAWGADVTVGGATAAGNYTIKATGYPLEESGAQKIVVKDVKSIAENGKLVYTFDDNHLIQTATMAKAIAAKCLALSKDPRRDLELDWRGNMALELGDKINVPDSKTTTADFYITSNELSFDGGLTCTTKGKKVV